MKTRVNSHSAADSDSSLKCCLVLVISWSADCEARSQTASKPDPICLDATASV